MVSSAARPLQDQKTLVTGGSSGIGAANRTRLRPSGRGGRRELLLQGERRRRSSFARSGIWAARPLRSRPTYRAICLRPKRPLKRTNCPARNFGAMITAAQCRSARTLLSWSLNTLASAASVPANVIDSFEMERQRPDAATIGALQRAFEDVGVEFLPDNDVRVRAATPPDR
jgi:hypothetical protein